MSPRASAHEEGVRLRLEPWELVLLQRLRDELVALLEEGDADDPAVERLFPPAVEDDQEADAELRALIGSELLTERLEGLREVLQILERGEEEDGEVVIDLSDEEPALVLGVVNDLRLALGARAAIEDVDREQLTEDDPVAPTVAVIDRLAWLQEELLGVIDPPSLSFYEDLRGDPDEDPDADAGDG